MSEAKKINLETFDVKEDTRILYSDYLLVITDEIEEPVPLLGWEDSILFSAGNVSCIGGAAKSCKTFLICYLAYKYLDENINGKVLLVDTEQAKCHTMRTLRRIYQLAGWDQTKINDRLTVLSLREADTPDRVVILQQAIEEVRPDMVFVDGIRDLVRDFNDPNESSIMVNLLMRLSSQYSCHICSVLHENKVGGQLRGHLGSELINKSETVIGVSRDGNVSTVKALYTRNKPFDEFYFRINEEGLPELCQPEKAPAKTGRLQILFDPIMPASMSISYADLKRKLIEAKGYTERTAEKKIQEATKEEVIRKNEAGFYYLPKEEPENETLPF